MAMGKEERQMAITIAAGVAAHAILAQANGGSLRPQALASQAFDHAEAFIAEAEKRAIAAGVSL